MEDLNRIMFELMVSEDLKRNRRAPKLGKRRRKKPDAEVARRQVLDEDVCHYCHQEIPYPLRTRDHIVPRSRGGKNARWNLVMACLGCNRAKGAMVSWCLCAKCERSRKRHDVP